MSHIQSVGALPPSKESDAPTAHSDSVAASEKVTTESVSFGPGTRWFLEGVEVELLSIPNLDLAIVRKLATNETIQVSRAALTVPPTQAQPGAAQAVDKSDDAELEYALKAQRALDRYVDGQVLDESNTQRIARELSVSVRTLRRWLEAYKAQRHLAVFLDKRPGPAKGTSKLLPEVEAIVDASIKAQLGLAGGVTVTSIADEIKSLCNAIGKESPAETSIQRRINAALKVPDNYPPELRDEVRRRLDLVRGSLEPSHPLEIVQVDHTVVDVLIRDPFTRQVIGRPTLTIAFEVMTRVVLGFVLSLEAPSQLSTALCLHHAVFPKEQWLKDIGATGPWPFFGLMRNLHTDLAAEFVSAWLKRAGKRYNIDILHRRGGAPQDGGHIERFLGTLSKRCHLLPGTTYIEAIKKKTSKSTPIFTLNSLKTWIANECTAYMYEPHDGLNKMSPAQAWEKAWTTKHGLVLPGYPKNEREFLLSFLPGDERVVTREGIDWRGLRYRSEALQSFIQPGVRRRFRFDKRDISAIYLEPLSGDHIRIPWINLNWEPISLWEWDEIRTRNGQRARVTDQETVRRARAANRALIDQQAKTSQRARKRVAREDDWKVAQRSEEAIATDRKLTPITTSRSSRARFEVLE